MKNIRIGFLGLVGLYGLFIMFAWKFGAFEWIRISEHYTAMSFNAALSIFLLSIACIGRESNQIGLMKFTSSTTLILGIMTLLQHLTYTPWDVEQFFHVGVGGPNEIESLTPVSTAICIVLMSTVLITSQSQSLKSVASWSLTLAIAIGLVSISGYLVGIGSSQAFKSGFYMSPQAAIAFLVISLANMRSSLRDSAFQIAAAVFTIVIQLVIAIEYREEYLMAKRNRKIATRENSLFEHAILERVGSLKRFADRVSLLESNKLFWQKDSQNYMESFEDIWKIILFNYQAKPIFSIGEVKSTFINNEKILSVLKTGKPKIFLEPNSQDLFWILTPAANKKNIIVTLHDVSTFYNSISGRMWSSHEIKLEDQSLISNLTEEQKKLKEKWGGTFKGKIAGSEWEITSIPDTIEMKNDLNFLSIILIVAGFVLSVMFYLAIKFYFIGQDNIIAQKKVNAELQTLLAFLPVGVYQTNPQGQCIWVNQSWMQKTGLSEKEAAGVGWQSAVHPEDRLAVYRDWEEAVKEGRSFEMRYRLLRKDQSIVWVQGKAKALYDENNNLTGYIGSVSEIPQSAEKSVGA